MWWFAVDNSARVVVPVSNMRDLMLWRMAVGPDRGGGKSARAGSLYGGGKVGHRVWLELIKMRVFLVWNSTVNCQIYFSYVRCVPACSNQPRPNPRVGSCLVGRGLGYPGSKSILGAPEMGPSCPNRPRRRSAWNSNAKSIFRFHSQLATGRCNHNQNNHNRINHNRNN